MDSEDEEDCDLQHHTQEVDNQATINAVPARQSRGP